MGFKKPLDYNRISHELSVSGYELNHPKNDGYIQWSIKQDLYKLKWMIDDILEKSPKFVLEDEFLRERQQNLVERCLKS